jgi:Actinobacteria/chloroflexi VLRF1 release factor
MDDVKTVRVAPERLGRWLDGFAERHGESVYQADGERVTVRAEDGAVARVVVPFPPLAAEEDVRQRLTEHVLVVRRVGVLLVRRGGYGAGVFEGPVLVDSKVGSRHVQGGTKAGGWSQQRFARRRENQAREAFAAAADVAARILLPARLDALVCGGDRKAVDTVLADPRLTPLTELVREPFLGVPDPRLRVLEQAGADARAIRIDLTEPAG